jgi:hypothetical protein
MNRKISLEGLIRSIKESHPDQDVKTWSWFQDCVGEVVTAKILFTPRKNQ